MFSKNKIVSEKECFSLCVSYIIRLYTDRYSFKNENHEYIIGCCSNYFRIVQ